MATHQAFRPPHDYECDVCLEEADPSGLRRGIRSALTILAVMVLCFALASLVVGSWGRW